MYLLDKSMNPGQALPVDSPEIAKRKQLIAMLRNSTLWPSHFKWDYGWHNSCALGLAIATAIVQSDCPNFISASKCGKQLGLTESEADRIFLFAQWHNPGAKGADLLPESDPDMTTWDVTPERVADLLEATL